MKVLEWSEQFKSDTDFKFDLFISTFPERWETDILLQAAEAMQLATDRALLGDSLYGAKCLPRGQK